ncbi:MAG TPA: hypothetical protein VL334_06525, partial [Anaerolineae bacterium]|nr:hypothetical protein [Anaerolineae bacterium]
MPSSPSLQPDYLPGSYSDRNYEARRLFDQGEMDQAAAICQRIIDRISRLPERRRPHDSSLHQSLLAALILLAEIHAKLDDWPAVDDLCMCARTLLPVYAHRWAVEPFVLRIQHDRSQEGIDGLQA